MSKGQKKVYFFLCGWVCSWALKYFFNASAIRAKILLKSRPNQFVCPLGTDRSALTNLRGNKKFSGTPEMKSAISKKRTIVRAFKAALMWLILICQTPSIWSCQVTYSENLNNDVPIFVGMCRGMRKKFQTRSLLSWISQRCELFRLLLEVWTACNSQV